MVDDVPVVVRGDGSTTAGSCLELGMIVVVVVAIAVGDFFVVVVVALLGRVGCRANKSTIAQVQLRNE